MSGDLSGLSILSQENNESLYKRTLLKKSWPWVRGRVLAFQFQVPGKRKKTSPTYKNIKKEKEEKSCLSIPSSR